MTPDDTKLATFIEQEGGAIALDMAGHVGEQVFEVLKRNGLAMRSEAGVTAMLAICARDMLEQAIDQCSRAAEDDCRKAVSLLFWNLLTDETKGAMFAAKDAEIEALRAENARLREALEPFAKAAYAFDNERRIVTEAVSPSRPNYYLTARDLHAARAALKDPQP